MRPIHRERVSALLIRVWIERDRNEEQRVVIRIAGRTDVKSGEQESALFGDVASAHIWVEQWLSDVVTKFHRT